MCCVLEPSADTEQLVPSILLLRQYYFLAMRVWRPAAACRELLVPAGSSSTSVPRFWLRVLRSADAAALAISSRDAAALASLADVRFSLSSSSSAAEIGASRELLGKRELAQLGAAVAAPSVCMLPARMHSCSSVC